jgi:hypothetical protein
MLSQTNKYNTKTLLESATYKQSTKQRIRMKKMHALGFAVDKLPSLLSFIILRYVLDELMARPGTDTECASGGSVGKNVHPLQQRIFCLAYFVTVCMRVKILKNGPG